MSHYIDPYTDFGFKRLFGEEANKDLLIDFLNSQLPDHHQIKVLEFRNTEQLGLIALDRKTVYDIYCEGENGEHFIVEMQKASQRWFKDRALFWTSFPIRNQAPKGAVEGKSWDFQLRAIYLIAVLGFEYDQDEERRKFIRDVQLKDQDGDLFYDKLRFIFLQMPLFTKKESELKTRSDKWCYFLKHLESFDSIPLIFREPIFERAFEMAAVARLTKEEAFQYEASRMTQWDNYSVVETARFEGETKGRAEGRAEGAVEIARNMKKKGLDPVLIAEMTGLSPDEIKCLKCIKN